jgi:uncharacterized membrane protein YfcA
LAACNAAGGIFGAHTAVTRGSRFVRWVFIAVVIALIANTGYDAWLRSF